MVVGVDDVTGSFCLKNIFKLSANQFLIFNDLNLGINYSSFNKYEKNLTQ